jgi:ABC-2 type transport system ATP-binding protein
VTTTVGGESITASSAPAREGAPAVSVAHVSKSFQLPHERYHTLKERALHPFRARQFDVLDALRDVSVEISEGEFFGVVGRNGSGKSTLLKCLAGIYGTDAGEISVRGRLAPFIELGVGFNPELAARDNVIINAVMLGLSRTEALERFDSIVAFAELEDYMDLKLKNYSSGMHVRLAFSVAIQVDAEVLLIDEVLAVGDASFQQKCFDEFARLKVAGRTIIFVTHDMGSVERFCDRAMLLERGEVVEIGAPSKVARKYNELNFRRERVADAEGGGHPSLPAEILDAGFESPDGERIVSAAQGEPCVIGMEVRFNEAIHNPVFSIGLFDELGRVVFVAQSHVTEGPSGDFGSGQTALVRIRFENWLSPARYHLTASVNQDGSAVDAYDTREDISSLIVHATKAAGGVVDLPHSFEIERR